MDNNYESDFERVKDNVGKLMEATNNFLENVITPVLNDATDYPAHIELEINSLIQETKDLAVSFFPLKQRIDEMNRSGVDFYSLIEFANRLETNTEEWKSQFVSIKDKYTPIVNALGQTKTSPTEPISSGELLSSIVDECSKVQKSLQENFLKFFVYKKLEPSIKQISDQVKELKVQLKQLGERWLPQTNQIKELIQSMMHQVEDLTQMPEFADDADKESIDLLEAQRKLYELFARQQIFSKIEPTLNTSLAQLDNLERSFADALEEWSPPGEEIKTSYQSILTKCKKLQSEDSETLPPNEEYQTLSSGFSRFEQEWNTTMEDLSGVLDKWVNRV